MSRGVLDSDAKSQLIRRLRSKESNASGSRQPLVRSTGSVKVPEVFTRFDKHPGYEKILVPKLAAERLGFANPFFISHEGIASAVTQINGREYINYANYNYLGLNGHPEVSQAAKDAIDRYGTTTSASRLVAGERPVQRELEQALANNYEVEDCVVFVSGHATNVTTLGCLFGPKDLIVHDSLIHNSVLEGIKLAGSARRSFAHNDTAALERILSEIRGQFERVLIVVEGHYSMDGDIPDLPALIDIKRRHQAFLMVDEAHSLGVLGASGKGLHEHYGVAGTDVDIWMGTLSKTLSGCGGYIAGEQALIDNLKFSAPGFVYSVGIAPALAAASLASLRIMQREPERIDQLRKNTRYFLEQLQASCFNTGHSQGYAVVPVITGSSLKAVELSNQLFELGINAQPIIYPAVEEQAARLRFFMTSEHTRHDMDFTIQALLQCKEPR